MNKTIKKFFPCLIALILLLTTLLGACTCNDTSSSDGNKNQNEIEDVDFTEGHNYTATKTNKPFISNGQTDYVLVLPNNYSSLLGNAKEEFIYFFEIATSIKLKVILENEVSQYPNKKFISIGETSLFKNSGISIDKKELKSDGHIIQTTEDGNIFLVGGGDYGSLYAVYTFMQVTFNYDVYYLDCFEIDKNIKNMNLLNYQIKDIPDFEYRACAWGSSSLQKGYDEQNFENRTRKKLRSANIMGVFKDFDTTGTSANTHNLDNMFPYETYGEKYPEWWSTNSTVAERHMCFNARGKFESTIDEKGNEIPSPYDAMVQLAADKITYSLTVYDPVNYPQYTTGALLIQDNRNVCKCDTCLEEVKMYGGYGGVIIEFMNDVGALVDEWMNKEENKQYYRDDFKILFFAYWDYIDPPLTYDEKNDTFIPINGLTMRDNIGIYLALSERVNNNFSIYHETNDLYRRNILEGWAYLTDYIYIWSYMTNFADCIVISPVFDHISSETYQFYKKNNVRCISTEAQVVNANSSNWEMLKCYLEYKLTWNCSLNVEDLMDKYFNAMYGDAAEIMRNEFNRQIGYMRKLYGDLGILEECPAMNCHTFNSSNDFPIGILNSWVNGFDEAKKMLNPNDPNYDMYIKHIELEQISPIYLTLKYYSQTKLSNEDKNDLENRLREYAIKLNASQIIVNANSREKLFDVLK